MNPGTIKYPAGRGIRVYFFNGKKHAMEVEHGPIWIVWTRCVLVHGRLEYGWHQTY